MADTAEPPAAPPADPPEARMPGARRPTRGVVGVTLVVLGLLLWLAYRLTISGEAHSYAAGATPPADVQLTRDHRYSVAIPGGVATVTKRLSDPTAVSCSITPAGGVRTQLAVTPEAATSRALERIATFVSPVSGRARISCVGLPAVYVDDSDDADTDLAGLWLVLGTISLTVGVPLTLSALRRRR